MNLREKNTKIVATISDMQCGVDFLKELYNSGMDVVRLNTAHQDFSGAKKVIENVRLVSDKIAIMLDTKGPEIRTRNISSPINVKKDELIKISGDISFEGKDIIYASYINFHKDVPLNSKILINDGELQFDVLEKASNYLLCKALSNGVVKDKKTINVPSVHLNLPSLSKKDIEFINFAIDNNLDFIAHSFVRNKEDVLAVQDLLNARDSKIKIIAKIENKEGFENIDEILDFAHGVMVARGDLGVEVLASEVPFIQKSIIAACLRKSKPVIVATQMLESMIKNPYATRAEISDVANAILDGTDAVMLSGETAYGDYPVEAVKTMAEISLSLAKRHRKTNPAGVEPDSTNTKMFLAKSAVNAALSLNASAIITPAHSGEVARVISAMRSRKPIFAPCLDDTLMRQLALSHGVRVFKNKEYDNTDEMVLKTVQTLVDDKRLNKDVLVVFVSGNVKSVEHKSHFLEIASVRDLLLYYKKY